MLLKRRRHSFSRKDLSLAEVAAFNTLEQFGWDIWFVRNAHADDRIVVLSQGKQVGALVEDGRWVERPEIELRRNGLGMIIRRTD